MAAGALCWTMLASVALSQEDLEPVQVGTPERSEVYPAEIKLTGPRQRMQLVVTGHYAGGGCRISPEWPSLCLPMKRL